MIEAFFFGPCDRQVFATYHPPATGTGQVLTLICPPLFPDYMRTQLALRELGISLSGLGHHVLRFDYRGTGDSDGDLSDVTVSDWIEDLSQAVREGCSISGSTEVRALGVRAGALLACRALGSLAEVRRLVLWDPVISGSDYVRELKRLQSTILERNVYMGRGQRQDAREEFAGYRVSDRMVKDLRSLDDGAYREVENKELRVVRTSPRHGFGIPGVEPELVPFECGWERGSEDLMMAQPVLEKLLECLATD